MEEEGETIQFYKIQVMEKDRQISNFQAKMKKTQLKFNREIKDAKNAEERAKNLLKEEKAKLDKLVIQAKENQQQNTLLQMRLTELQESKDKEVAEVRSQFNSIKDKTRTSQRLLPTNTFLSDIGLEIEQLPIYEDIYVNLREKHTQLEKLKLKYEEQKNRAQETLKSSKQNEEIMRKQIEDLNKTNQDLLQEIKDHQENKANLEKTNSELNQTIIQKHNDLEQEKNLVSYLQNQLKDSQLHIEQLNHSLISQQQTAEQQIQAAQQQIHLYEQEIETLHLKDNQNLSQISILQQEIHSAQNELIAEKGKLEQAQEQTNEQIENLRQQWRKQKTQTEELQSKYSEKVNDLIRVSLANEKHEEKIKSLQKFTEQIWEESTMRKATEVESKSRIKQLQVNNQTLVEAKQALAERNQALVEGNQALVESNQTLRSKIDSLEKENIVLTNQTHQANQKYNQAVLIHQNHQQLPKEQNGQAKAEFEASLALKQLAIKSIRQEMNLTNSKNSQLQQTLLQCEKKAASYVARIQQLCSNNNNHQSTIKQKQSTIASIQLKIKQHQSTIKLHQSAIKQHQSTIKLHQSSIKQHQSAAKLHQSTIQQQTKQIQLIKDQNEQNLKQLLESKQKIAAFTKKSKEDEATINSLTTKHNLQTSKANQLQSQLDSIKGETLANNQTIKGHKEEIKNMREANSTLMERYTKETRDLTNQLNLLRHEKEKSKTEFSNREKQLVQDIAALKNNKDKEGKLNQQIGTLKEEIRLLQSNKNDLQKTIADHSRSQEDLNKKITVLEEANLQKQRDLEIMSLSLERERRERSLRAVPSLQSLQDQQAIQRQNFNDMYLLVTQKEGSINLLQREVSDLKQEIEGLKLSQTLKLETLEAEQNQYIQAMIGIKIKMAETEMRASEKEYLYTQIKKKMAKLTTQQQ